MAAVAARSATEEIFARLGKACLLRQPLGGGGGDKQGLLREHRCVCVGGAARQVRRRGVLGKLLRRTLES